jgi:3-methyladenine DNA glycosylase AlkD
MMNPLHKQILKLIEEKSGKGTKHTMLDSYLGNKNPRYAITAPVLRKLAKEWMRANKELSTVEFTALLTSLIKGKSSTEKVFAGILMDYCSHEQGAFNPEIFDHWLEHLEGWAEIDSVCTGQYTIHQVVPGWKKWKPLLVKLSKNKNINKRRASLVLFCSPLRHSDDELLAKQALENIERLKSEKAILITKAISWVLRSMDKNFKKLLTEYLKENMETLPKIAVRETMVKLKTGKKTKSKFKV